MTPFVLQQKDEFGDWQPVYQGTTIGHKKICPLSGKPVQELRIFVTSARDRVLLRSVQAY